jgi:hypothetical protein
MLSRRAFLLSAAASTALPTLAQAQTPPQPSAGPYGGAPTVLRLARRGIEVNGKSASVYGSPTALSASAPRWASVSACEWRTASTR